MIKDFLTYIKENKLTSLLALFISGIAVPLIPFQTTVYYAIAICLFLYMASRPNMKLKSLLLVFFVACGASIIINNPPSVFQSWFRLGLLVIIAGAFSFLFESSEGNKFHHNLMMGILWISALIGVGSFFCYLLGINYMQKIWGGGAESVDTVGGFGGLTGHSMLLGPISAFGSIFLVCQFLYNKYQTKEKIICLSGIGLCLLSTLLSSSRGALACAVIGIIVALYCRYNATLSKLIQNFIVAGVFLIALFPLYSSYTEGVVSKQENNERIGGTFSSREERWGNRIEEFKSSPVFGIGFGAISTTCSEWNISNKTGIVEPGSSYLGILSMTGLLGFIPFITLLLGAWKRIKKIALKSNQSMAPSLFAILSACMIHMITEGYVLAAGSFLSFYFWLLLGVCGTYIPPKPVKPTSSIY